MSIIRKYRNQKTAVNGITFDSKKEAARYGELKILERAGKIKELKLQVKYDLAVNGLKICSYKSDFTYFEEGQQITEDVKGMKTRVYEIKKKLMKAIHGIEIRET